MLILVILILILMVLILMAARSFPVVAGRLSLRCQTPYYHQPPAFPTGLTCNSPLNPTPPPRLLRTSLHSTDTAPVVHVLMVSSTASAIPVYRHTAIQRQTRVTAKGEYCNYAFLPLDGSTDGRSALPSRPTPAGCPIPLCDAQSRSRCGGRRLNAPRGHRPAPGSRVVCMFEHRDAPQPRYRAVAVAVAMGGSTGARRGAVMYRRHRRSSSPSAAGTAQ